MSHRQQFCTADGVQKSCWILQTPPHWRLSHRLDVVRSLITPIFFVTRYCVMRVDCWLLIVADCRSSSAIIASYMNDRTVNSNISIISSNTLITDSTRHQLSTIKYISDPLTTLIPVKPKWCSFLYSLHLFSLSSPRRRTHFLYLVDLLNYRCCQLYPHLHLPLPLHLYGLEHQELPMIMQMRCLKYLAINGSPCRCNCSLQP